jgi:hypothetical protein
MRFIGGLPLLPGLLLLLALRRRHPDWMIREHWTSARCCRSRR